MNVKDNETGTELDQIYQDSRFIQALLKTVNLNLSNVVNVVRDPNVPLGVLN